MDKSTTKKGRWSALRTWMLTAAAVMLIMSAVIGSAWAYFTTYATAKGSIPLRLGHEEKIEEYFRNWNKRVLIEVSADSRPVFIRAKGFCKDIYPLTYSDVEQYEGDKVVNKNWVPGDDGWYYYHEAVSPGKDKEGKPIAATAEPLYVRINNVPEEEIQGVDDKDPFNVIIVYETTEAEYDENGKEIDPRKAGWDKEVNAHKAGGDK